MKIAGLRLLSLCLATLLLPSFLAASANASEKGQRAKPDAGGSSPNYNEIYLFGTVANDGIHSFDNLAQASDGNFYGTLADGGEFGNGVVFSITPSYAYTVLYSFQSGADGGNPHAGLVQAPDGYLYGTTTSGGSGNGTIFRLRPGATTIETVYTFKMPSLVYGAMALDGRSNLYGMTHSGGANGLGSIFRYSLKNGYKLLHSFSSSDVYGAGPVGSPLVASDGKLYGTTNGSLWQMDTNGKEFQTYYVFADAEIPPNGAVGGLTEAVDGNLYGLSRAGGRFDYGAIYSATPGTTPNFAVPISFGETSTNEPAGGTMSTDSAGNLFYNGAGGPDSNGTGAITVYNVLNASDSILSSFLYDSGNTPQAQPLLASDGNLYGTTLSSANSQQAQGSIYEYMLGDTPAPVTLTASSTSITLGQNVKLTFAATNAFSKSMGTCFLTDNMAGDTPLVVSVKGSRKETPTTVGTVTYGYTCGGVESATQTITVNQ